MFARRCYVLGVALAVTMCVGLSAAIANDDCNLFGCSDDCEFTMDFRLQDCWWFQTVGINPFFKLIPGYQLVLESGDERAEVTVLWDTKWIDLMAEGLGRFRTRVVEERAYEWDDEEWVLIEISRNYFAICKKTNAVYYFGEFSQECENGFNEDEDMCEPEEEDAPETYPDTTGSWEAGVNGARPGLIMPGTPLLGAKYFQEIAPPDAVDRGEIVEMGLTWPPEEDLGEGEEPDFSGCINIIDTNPAEGLCGEEGDEPDSKLYCPGVGLVQDEELELVDYGFVHKSGCR